MDSPIVETDFFLDTGSAISIISLEYLNYLGLNPTQNDSLPPLSSINGSQEPMLGASNITVEFGHFRAPVTFYVVRNAIAHVILGMDFAKQHVRMINILDNMVAFSHPFAIRNSSTLQFPSSNFGHYQSDSFPHQRSNSSQSLPIKQEIKNALPNHRSLRSSKRNLHPSLLHL